MKSKKIRDWIRNKARNKNMPKAGAAADGQGGYIYVIYLGMDNIYKIGRTVNIEARIKSLAAANPRLRADVVKRVADMYACESHLHAKYSDKRVDGRECYALRPGDIEKIQAYLDSRSPVGITRAGG